MNVVRVAHEDSDAVVANVASLQPGDYVVDSNADAFVVDRVQRVGDFDCAISGHVGGERIHYTYPREALFVCYRAT